MAEKAKEAGNESMKQDKFVEAMMHYTEAVKLNPNIAAIYSNRSLAFLKMQQYYLALEDAKTAIKLEPKWPKGYYRMGEIQFQIELYKDALWSYKQALNFSPEDEKLKNAVDKAKNYHSVQVKAEKRLPVYGVIAGMILGVLICAADQILTKSPVLHHVLVQGMTVVAISGLCYAGTICYRFFIRSQRRGLLEQPLALFDDDDDKAKATEQNGVQGDASSDNKPRKRMSAANAKQKARQSAKS